MAHVHSRISQSGINECNGKVIAVKVCHDRVIAMEACNGSKTRTVMEKCNKNEVLMK